MRRPLLLFGPNRSVRVEFLSAVLAVDVPHVERIHMRLPCVCPPMQMRVVDHVLALESDVPTWAKPDLLGSLDDGYLTLKDRSKDVIISGGINIYPREVEEVLLRHASVKEVSVIGRADSQWGESVVACVWSTTPLWGHTTR